MFSKPDYICDKAKECDYAEECSHGVAHTPIYYCGFKCELLCAKCIPLGTPLEGEQDKRELD